MEQEEISLEMQLQQARCAQRDLFFVNLLSGGVYESPEKIREFGAQVSVAFPYDRFVVLLARKESWGQLYSGTQADSGTYNFILRNVLENGLPDVTQAACVLGDMAAIINLPGPPELPALVQRTNEILEVLETEYGISATVSISQVYSRLEDVPKAYQDAVHVLEYQQLMGADAPVTAYEQLTHPYLISPPSGNYFSTEQKMFRCVQNRDFTGLQIGLHELIDNEFGASRPTVNTLRFRVYGVVNMLLNLMNDLRVVVGNEIIDALDVGPRLTTASSVAEILGEMDDILDRLIEMTQQENPDAPGWTAQVRQYIRENYRNPDTTVAAIADHFHLTPTYCSKVYREVYGVRLLEEIQRLRLEEAKRLLRGKDSVRVVAEKAGFPSPLTMSRAFKRYEAALPSNFRANAEGMSQ